MMATSVLVRTLTAVVLTFALSIVSCAAVVPRLFGSPAPPLPARPTDPRTNGHTATVLLDGRVLVIGGYATAPGAFTRHSLASAELYDPDANSWAPASSMHSPRVFHTATALKDGRVLVLGGNVGLRDGLAPSAGLVRPPPEVYDPASNSWSTVSEMPPPVINTMPQATMLDGGEVLVIGFVEERRSAAQGRIVMTATRYDPASGQWASAGEVNWEAWPTGPPDYYFSVTVTPGGRVLAVYSTAAKSYDPTTNAWHDVAAPPERVRGHAATLLGNGEVLLVGGSAASDLYDIGHISRRTYRYDPARDHWTRGADMRVPRFAANLISLPQGQVIAWRGFGPHPGTLAAGPLGEPEIYSPPPDDRWSGAARLTFDHTYATASVLRSGHVLFLGEGGIARYDPTLDCWSEVNPWE